LSSGSAVTVINRLERQLNEERSEREKMRKEIEDLKKMNIHLAQAISQSAS
jgi:predicted RNase H-like nuclease (RuvC/YqgF family)